MAEHPETIGPAPGFVKAPEYEVRVEPAGQRIRAYIADECIADSNDALVMHETNHQRAWYFPRGDVRAELIEKSDHDSF